MSRFVWMWKIWREDESALDFMFSFAPFTPNPPKGWIIARRPMTRMEK